MRRIVFIISIVMCIFIIGYGNGNAMVSGPCANCHTMHYSQNGTELPAWGSAGPYNTLLVNDCLGCHSSSTKSTYYEINGVKYPVVFYTGGGAPGTYLAGGNFYWVKEGLGGDDTKGHNVFLGEPDDNLDRAPGDTGRASCGASSCHKNMSEVISGSPEATLNGRQGCIGCHMLNDDGKTSGYHHADDSNIVVGSDLSDTDGYYRFLTGHQAGSSHGVSGIEDDDWQASTTVSNHNEYLGLSLPKDTRVKGLWDPLGGHTMTIYCCGCHGNFHLEQNVVGGPWIRHPSDSVIPDRDEYADAYGAAGGGTGVYDVQVPVARDDLSGWPGPSATVTLDSDMVMCLSCHRPHGSPYPDMLRWDYDTMVAGGSGSGGCFTCHTQKN